jgi:hypothetical protein
MRGFIKILESIIASIIIISAITFFFSFSRPSESRQTESNYVLPALQKSGLLDEYITNNDVTSMTQTLKNMLPPSVDFSVEISGIPNPEIKIACVCTDAEESDFVNRLSPLDFPYLSRTLHIRIENGNGDPFDYDNFRNLAISDANILFFPAYRVFSTVPPAIDKKSEIELLKDFLQRGTLFMVANLQEAEVNDGVMDNLFGLEWHGQAAKTGEFHDIVDTNMVSYTIAKYYAALGGDKSDGFDKGFPPGGENKIPSDDRSIVVHNSEKSSMVKINKVGSKGRTVWFINYDTACSPPPPCPPNVQKMNRLLKASMLWASGERYSMDPQFKRIPSLGTLRQYTYTHVLDGSEPLAVSLKIWNVFY